MNSSRSCSTRWKMYGSSFELRFVGTASTVGELPLRVTVTALEDPTDRIELPAAVHVVGDDDVPAGSRRRGREISRLDRDRTVLAGLFVLDAMEAWLLAPGLLTGRQRRDLEWVLASIVPGLAELDDTLLRPAK
jgi:hypothetical protein